MTAEERLDRLASLDELRQLVQAVQGCRVVGLHEDEELVFHARQKACTGRSPLGDDLVDPTLTVHLARGDGPQGGHDFWVMVGHRGLVHA